LSNSVKHYLEIIEASLLDIQTKPFADNHRCVFHFSESLILVIFLRKHLKKVDYMDENKQRNGFFSYKANIIIDKL